MIKLKRRKKKPGLLKRRRAVSEETFIIKTPAKIEKLASSGSLVADCFDMLRESVQPGAKLSDLDRMVEEHIIKNGAKSLYKGYRGNPPTHPPFPGTICASINEEICHGLPDDRILNDGDIIGIDIGLLMDGYCGDACVTFPVGTIPNETQQFIKVAEECLYVGIAAAQVGNRLGMIGAAIEKHAKKNRYSVVYEWGGHGIGKNLHEPVSVPHHGPAAYGPVLAPGMTFTIEPMVNMGKRDCKMMPDGWSVETQDGSLSAQYEHTIAITDYGPRILSTNKPSN
ncbi:MAG: type I methionyl aminopeptidase [Chloroflexota bacterium]